MKYKGSCHCKKVSYEVEFELTECISCNCSHCEIKGLLLAFVPSSSFTLASGSDTLTSYHFNKKVIDHLFCSVCGVESFAKGKDKDGNGTVAVNIRTLHDVDLESLPCVNVDGKNW